MNKKRIPGIVLISILGILLITGAAAFAVWLFKRPPIPLVEADALAKGQKQKRASGAENKKAGAKGGKAGGKKNK